MYKLRDKPVSTSYVNLANLSYTPDSSFLKCKLERMNKTLLGCCVDLELL